MARKSNEFEKAFQHLEAIVKRPGITFDPTRLTDGIETPTYDAAGRTIKVTHPDNTFSRTFYGPTVTAAGGVATQLCTSGTYGLGFPTLFVDESGRKRQTWTDGYGRTIEGDEPDGTGALTSYEASSGVWQARPG